MNLMDYRISGNNTECFQSEAFRDISALKLYMKSTENNKAENNPFFDFVLDMVNTMSQLRFLAEEKYKKHQFTAKNKSGALPLSWDEIDDVFTKKTNDPPIELITRIAQQELYVIEHVVQNARKVLKRDRKSEYLSSVQQLDSQCLRWLTRRPGISPAQKAGSSQRIMAVVREESYNTLENRVLKVVLNECAIGCGKYLRRHGDGKYSGSSRIEAVRRLSAFCSKALLDPFMERVGTLHEAPIPNYVLHYDPFYSKIWRMYRDLLRQKKLQEDAWKSRHVLFYEYFFLAMCVVLDINYSAQYKSDIWINYGIQNGHFLQAPFFSRILCSEGKCIEFLVSPVPLGSQIGCDAVLRCNHRRLRISLFYVPSDVQGEFTIQEDKSHLCIIHRELGGKIFSARPVVHFLKIQNENDFTEKIEELVYEIGGRLVK